jgi:Mg-chelatase subunit ChlD
VRFDSVAHAKLVGSIRKHVRVLRAYLERLGLQPVDEHAARRGRRLDLAQASRASVTHRPGVLVFSRDENRADAYLGVLIDRSGSMAGMEIDRAKAFGALLAESARGLRGIVGHVSAFDSDTFYRLGDFRRHAIASLDAADGNNDAGALARGAELALRSGKRNKLLVMISDDAPSGCSPESLERLVAALTHHGIVCAHVAVREIRSGDRSAFPHVVDLGKYDFSEAVARFGRLIVKLTSSWR